MNLESKCVEKYAGNENRILVALERTGEVLVSCLALVAGGFISADGLL